MPRSRIFGLYMLLGVFALGAGLLVARLFGSTPALPTISATPVASAITEAPAPTDAGLATTPGASSQTTTPTSDLATAAPAPTSAARPTTPAATTAAPASGYIEYTVQKADSLKGL